MRFILESLVWLCLNVAACIADDLPWWKTAVLYQVYPRSFKDSNGDGVGDLNGILQKAEHFKEIGVDGFWISPINKSPMVDMGYDVSNYKDIEPEFGTLDDFDNLCWKMRSLGIKVMMDFVPNHCSDQHPWFLSATNKSDPHHKDYKDFFVWKEARGWNGTIPLPPNNWMSAFGGSSWEWNEELQLFYLHQFRVQQPDLNYRNPNVVDNMTDVMRFWMDRGVSGFRVDAVKFLFENDTFADEPAIPGTKGDSFFNMVHKYTQNQPETFELMKLWSDFIRQRDLLENVDRLFLLEEYDPLDTMMRYYGEGDEAFRMPFNVNLMDIDQDTRSSDIKEMIMSWMMLMPQGAVSSWVIGNHDNSRVSTKCGPDMVDAMNLLTGVLPGIKVTYYGEEIGMQDTHVRPDQEQDRSIYNRDGCRTPMQWDDSTHGGFSTNKTWLPVNPNYWWLNVAAQRSARKSHLKVFQEMTKARKDPVLQRGDLTVLIPDNDTLIILRSYNHTYFTLVINVGSDTRSYTSHYLFNNNVPDTDMSVVIGSANSDLQQGSIVSKSPFMFTLRPKAAVLLKSSFTSSTSSALKYNSLMFSLLVIFILLTSLDMVNLINNL